MINSVNLNNVNNKFYSKPISNQKQDEETEKRNVGLSGYEASQAILNRNNITFRNLTTPIEVTDKYNKKIEGKDHLDLPNIHVYEYPDTNLQVFVNEVNKTTDKNKFRASFSLYNKGIKNDSIVKKNLLLKLLNESFRTNGIDADLNEHFASFINIDLNYNTSKINKMNSLNEIISKSRFSEHDLEICKNELINTINSEKYQKETAEFKSLIGNDLLNSKEETITNIKNLTIDDINSYYSEILKNSEAQYVVTIDKSFVNENKKLFYSSLNSNFSNKFQKHSDSSICTSNPIVNNKDIRNYDNKNATFLTFHYPIQVKSNKDFLTYKYLTWLEFLWREPYVANDFEVKKYSIPMELKDSINSSGLGYLNFSFTPRGNENIYSTEDAISIFKAILEVLYGETLSANTLESVKDCDKEYYDERLNKKFDNDTHKILQNYRGDIFKIYEILNDIKIDDIRHVIEQILFGQSPVIIINEELNPYVKEVNNT